MPKLVLAQSNYETITQELLAIHENHLDHTQLFQLGENDQGLEIEGIKISKNLNLSLASRNRNNQLIVATHHGNEQAAADLAMQFVNDLLEIIENSNDTTLANNNYFIIPVLNVSGYNQNRREETLNAREKIDSNRDYPDPCAPNKENFQLKSTSLLADFIEDKNIVSAVTIHGYYGSFTYPWGTQTDHRETLDQDTYYELAEHAVQANHYEQGTHADVIYPTVGAFEDWVYWQHGVWVGLVEMDYRYDLAEDSQMLLSYFREVPTERTLQSSHQGTCEDRLRYPFLSRP